MFTEKVSVTTTPPPPMRLVSVDDVDPGFIHDRSGRERRRLVHSGPASPVTATYREASRRMMPRRCAGAGWPPSRATKRPWAHVRQRERRPGGPEAAATALKTRPLTSLYNARPTWLADAHAALDAAVATAYGWPADISDDDALAELLALNLANGR